MPVYKHRGLTIASRERVS